MCNCVRVHLLMIPLLRMTIDFAFTQWNGISWKTVSTEVLMNSLKSCVKWVYECSYSIHFIFYITFQLFWEEIELVSFLSMEFFIPAIFFDAHIFDFASYEHEYFTFFDLFVSIHIINFSTRVVTYGRTSKSKCYMEEEIWIWSDWLIFVSPFHQHFNI